MISKTHFAKWHISLGLGFALLLAASCSTAPKPNPEAEAAAAALQKRANEGRIYVGKVTLAQQEYHKSHAEYSSDLKALLVEQKIDFITESENYTYSTAESEDGKAFTMTAIPKGEDLPSIIGMVHVYATVDETPSPVDGKTYVTSTSDRRICETVGPSKAPPSTPVIDMLSLTCAPDTQESKW
ncbi:type IV pilin-like G/H family protein [Spirulina sp. CCNP1310]|uniref:type IV pilin-like G/H family protein n=1 Tax=Spirulina sp. CCNP1310 TaxID=3110249 RepID=UPI002B1F131D|nr:type IV pilin-like G/H family protein [Spirulina sp. CCNP1310]